LSAFAYAGALQKVTMLWVMQIKVHACLTLCGLRPKRVTSSAPAPQKASAQSLRSGAAVLARALGFQRFGQQQKWLRAKIADLLKRAMVRLTVAKLCS